MEQDSDKDKYSTEYMQRVYQSLLKKGNNISLAELNKSPPRGDDVTVANQSQIRQTVKIIQSNGSQKTEASATQKKSQNGGKGVPVTITPISAATSGAAATSVSLLTTPTRGRGESCIMGYKRRQLQKHRKPQNGITDPYYHRWKNLKKYVKQTVFINAAVCDEVVRYEEKLAGAREERRFLLRKLLHYQSMAENQSTVMKQIPTSLLKSSSEEVTSNVKAKAKKKIVSPATSEQKKKQTKDMLENMGVKPKTKKGKVSGGKLVVPPIPLDNLGRPIFPIAIGDLTLHSVGEIVPDRPGFHTSNSIFPVGYCSTRLYASVQDLDKQCLYTCKISDGGTGPMFEIVQEDSTDVFRSRFLSECHSQLLRAINHARGTKVVDTTGKGPDFFGLSHPVVQNLIQSCPGAKKCNGYKWMKFEVNKGLTIERLAAMSDDPSISQQALRAKIIGEQSPSNLRSLLTGALPDKGKMTS